MALFPLSLTGAATVAVGLYAYAYVGRDDSDYVLYAGGLVALGLVALSSIFTALGALVLWRSLPSDSGLHDTFEAETQLDTALVLPSFALWPLVRVDVRWDDPAQVSTTLAPQGLRRVRERLIAHRRGHYRRVRRRFEVADLFGLARVRFFKTWEGTFTILPASGHFQLSLALRHAGGDGYSHPSGTRDGELVEMRGYAHGDPLRLVVWKVFGRTRRLLVRMPERAITPRPSTVAYLVAGPGDAPAASTARAFVEQGMLDRDTVFSADGADRPAEDPAQAIDQIVDSVDHRHRGGADLERLLRTVDRSQLGNCVLFVPTREGPWLERVLTFSRALPAPPTVILAVDGTLAELRRHGTLRRLIFDDPAGQTRGQLRDLPELYGKLRRAGLDVKVIHRPSGQLLGETEITALERIAAAA